jgi:hypothetical protein
MAKLGGRSPKRGKTTAALGKIRCEGEASGGRRWWYRSETVGREAALERGAERSW